MEATAKLLAMGTVSPLGEPIEAAVREAVLRELAEHGQKYGARLHIAVPGAPGGNIDLELFEDNPAAVIKLLHTFHGPSPYQRHMDEPNEDEKRMRHWQAVLLRDSIGPKYSDGLLKSSTRVVIQIARGHWGSCFLEDRAANSSGYYARR